MNFEKAQPLPLDVLSQEILSRSPLHYACYKGDTRAVETLLSQVFVYNTQDDAATACMSNLIMEEDCLNGWTPAHWAALYGNLDCLMKLHLKPHLGFDTPIHRSNTSPLHLAAQSGAVLCLKWLLQCGASSGKQDFLGDTALHKSSKSGNTDCASMLVAHGASLQLKNLQGRTPAEVAEKSGHLALSCYLRRALDQSEYGSTTTSHHVFNSSPALPIPTLQTVQPQCAFVSASVSHPGIVMNGEAIYNSYSSDHSPDEQMDHLDTDMADGETMSAEGCPWFKPQRDEGSPWYGLEQNPGKKRTIDMEDEEEVMPTYKRRCFVPLSQMSSEERFGTAYNNNIISSYNAVLAMRTEPKILHTDLYAPSRQSSDQAQSSLVEHEACVEAQQGYDSTVITAMRCSFH